MPDIGFTELILIAVVLFVIVGPERMPGLLADLARWMRKGRSLASQLRRELDMEVSSIKQEIPVEDIQAFNEAKMEVNKIGGELRETELDLRRKERELNQSLRAPVEPPAQTTSTEEPPADTGTAAAVATNKPESA